MTIDEKRRSNADSASRNRFLRGSLDKKLSGIKRGALLLKRKHQMELVLSKLERLIEELEVRYEEMS